MNTFRLDRLIGREVLTANNRRLGRLEECRVVRNGADWTVTEWVIGSAGLFERLGLGTRLILGIAPSGGYIVRWEQLDLTNVERPRLLCPVEELRRV